MRRVCRCGGGLGFRDDLPTMNRLPGPETPMATAQRAGRRLKRQDWVGLGQHPHARRPAHVVIGRPAAAGGPRSRPPACCRTSARGVAVRMDALGPRSHGRRRAARRADAVAMLSFALLYALFVNGFVRRIWSRFPPKQDHRKREGSHPGILAVSVDDSRVTLGLARRAERRSRPAVAGPPPTPARTRRIPPVRRGARGSTIRRCPPVNPGVRAQIKYSGAAARGADGRGHHRQHEHGRGACRRFLNNPWRD